MLYGERGMNSCEFSLKLALDRLGATLYSGVIETQTHRPIGQTGEPHVTLR
jgi:hypothetical protein